MFWQTKPTPVSRDIPTLAPEDAEDAIVAKITLWHRENMRFLAYLDAHFIQDWRIKIRQLWTIRLALFYIVLTSVFAIWDALIDTLPRWIFISGGLVMGITLGLARLTKQPGVDE